MHECRQFINWKFDCGAVLHGCTSAHSAIAAEVDCVYVGNSLT
jgi:hypothetical protein